MSVKRLSSEQVARKVGFRNLQHWTIIMIAFWPGCECHIFPPGSHIFIILFKPDYEQDVCYTLFACESLMTPY